MHGHPVQTNHYKSLHSFHTNNKILMNCRLQLVKIKIFSIYPQNIYATSTHIILGLEVSICIHLNLLHARNN